MLKKVAKDPVNEAKAIKEALKKPKGPIMLTPEQAWAHMVLTNRTKEQYKLDRKLQKAHNALIYPDYNIIRYHP